eukprot:363864-Chlamydomonas_euryale.AAC.16
MVGNGRLEAQCIDGKKRMCHIRGKMRKKVWVATGDIVLLGLRDYQDEKADVILKYTADEARVLKQYGELPENIRINDTDIVMEGEDNENAGACMLGRVMCIQLVHWMVIAIMSACHLWALHQKKFLKEWAWTFHLSQCSCACKLIGGLQGGGEFCRRWA